MMFTNIHVLTVLIPCMLAAIFFTFLYLNTRDRYTGNDAIRDKKYVCVELRQINKTLSALDGREHPYLTPLCSSE